MTPMLSEEEDAQARIDRHHAEQKRKRQQERMVIYLERLKVYEDARAAGQFPVEMMQATS